MTADTDTSRTTPAHRRRNRAALGVGSVLVVGAGVAFAYWTTTGSGTGEAEAGTTVPATIAQAGAVTNLYPGGVPQEIKVRVTNPGTTEVQVNGVTAKVGTGDFTVEPPGDADDANGCTAVDFDVTTTAIPQTPISPGATSDTLTVGTIAMKNLPENQNDCKGVTVPLEFTITNPGGGIGG